MNVLLQLANNYLDIISLNFLDKTRNCLAFSVF